MGQVDAILKKENVNNFNNGIVEVVLFEHW